MSRGRGDNRCMWLLVRPCMMYVRERMFRTVIWCAIFLSGIRRTCLCLSLPLPVASGSFDAFLIPAVTMEIHGGLFLSAAFWEAGAWQGPKMTVIETPSNVSPTARGHKQGHSIFILILKTWTFLTTNKTSQTCQVENYANIKLFLSQNTVSTEGCLGVESAPVVLFSLGIVHSCWRNWRHKLRKSLFSHDSYISIFKKQKSVSQPSRPLSGQLYSASIVILMLENSQVLLYIQLFKNPWRGRYFSSFPYSSKGTEDYSGC